MRANDIAALTAYENFFHESSQVGVVRLKICTLILGGGPLTDNLPLDE